MKGSYLHLVQQVDLPGLMEEALHFSVQYCKDDVVHKIIVQADTPEHIPDWAGLNLGQDKKPFFIKPATKEDLSLTAYFGAKIFKVR